MGSGRLFQEERPMHYNVFCPMSLCLLRKECLRIGKDCVYFTVPSEFKDFIEIKETVFIENMKLISFMHSSTCSPECNQFVDLNPVRDICYILSK